MDGPESPVTQVKIVSDIPVVFADAVSMQTYGPGISKFYLVRIDPDPLGAGSNKVAAVLQVVMPMDGFIQMWAFFEQRLKTMLKDGVISKSEIDKAREAVQQLPGSSSEPL
jgi:hypothetical protein